MYKFILEIDNLSFDINIGYEENERNIKQKIHFFVKFAFPETKPLKTPASPLLLPCQNLLGYTVCYNKLTSLIYAFCYNRKFDLLENLATQICSMIKDSINIPCEVMLTIEKHNPPLDQKECKIGASKVTVCK